MTAVAAGFAPSRRHAPLWLLVLVTFSGTLAMHMFVPALTVAANDLAVAPATIRMTISVYIIGMGLGQLVYGPLSDAFGRRPTLIAGLALYTLGGLVSLVAPNVQVLIAARFVQAAGGCAGLLLGRAIVRDTSASNEAVRRLALMSLITMVGPGLAPMIGGLLASSLGWRSIFVVLTLLGLVNVFITWRLLPETGRPGGHISPRIVLADYRALLGSPRFLGFALGGGCATTAFYGFIAAAPFIFINELHRPIHEVGVYLAILIVGVSLGNLLASRLVGRVRIDRLLVAGNVLSLASAAVMLAVFVFLHPQAWMVVAIMAVYCMGAGISSPAVSTLSISVDPKLIGSAAGLYGFFQMAVGALSTTLSGVGADPALAASSVLLGAGLLSQAAFRIALRTPANDVAERDARETAAAAAADRSQA